MTRFAMSWIGAAALLAAMPAAAADLREFCPDRPGIGTPPCIVDKGHAALEVGLGDWMLDKQPASRTDTLLLGDALVRYGLTDTLEAQIEWTALGHQRTRDRLTGAVAHGTGTGDVTLALRQNLRSPDGSGFSISLQPFATLPVGGDAIGAGDWGAGLLVPGGYELSDTVQLTFTGEVDAAVDQDRDGRHLAYGGIGGVQVALAKTLNASLELEALRDRDPQGHQTELLTGLSFGWMASKSFQLDAGFNAGLNRDTPDAEAYFGFSRRF